MEDNEHAAAVLWLENTHTHERICAAEPSPRGTCWDADDQPRELNISLPPYPYSLEALLTCGKCWAVYPAIFAYPTLDGWRLDTIVEHHASHRLGRCCLDPKELVA
jgi:hypothetical protein